MTTNEVYLFYKNEEKGRARVGLKYFVEPARNLKGYDGFICVNEEDIPKEEKIAGKMAIMYCNPDDSTVWYEYKTAADTIHSVEDRLKNIEETVEMLVIDALGGERHV